MERCPSIGPDNKQCMKSLQQKNKAHEGTCIYWVGGLKSEGGYSIRWHRQFNNVLDVYTGDTCSDCGGIHIIRTGTCSTCQTCGTTTGCA